MPKPLHSLIFGMSILFAMNPAICCVPVSPLRAEPSHRSEMVSQLLFGETCDVLEQVNRDWCRVRGRFDGYEGYCQPAQLTVARAKGVEAEAGGEALQMLIAGQPMDQAAVHRDAFGAVNNSAANQRSGRNTPRAQP